MKMDCLEDCLRRNAELHPQRIAVICDTESVTYSELWQLCCERSSQLQKEGIRKGEVRFFRASQDISFLANYFGIHLSGAVSAPLGEDFPQDMFQCLVSEYNDVTLSEDIADVLYTTGTTGKSKGVKVSYRTIMAEAENLAIAQGFSRDTLFVICGPLNHIGSLSKVFPTIYMGGALYITKGMKDMESVFKALAHPNGKIGTFLVPASIRILLHFGSKRLAELSDNIDFIETGAAAINEKDMKMLCEILPDTRLFNTYASTETGIISTYNFNNGECIPGCLGKPMKNSHFFITEDGYVACSGKTIMSGYLGEKELTDKVLVNGTIYTSDKGFIDDDCMLHLQGRADDIINIGGFKVNPFEVENAAMSFPGIKDCICIAHNHPILGTVLKLMVVCENKEEFSKRKLALHINSSLERYKVPEQYELVDRIARTFNGKLDRKFYTQK